MRKPSAAILILFLAAAAAQAPGPASALFGFGKDKQESSGRPPELPGMEAGGLDVTKPPRMAQEAAETDFPGAAPAPATDSPAAPVSDGSLPTEVVIKGSNAGKLKVNKPPLNIEVDPFDSIRESLKPDQKLLLSESPLAVVWRRTHPELLRSSRVIQPHGMTFSERPGIVFSPRKRLHEVLRRPVEDKEARGYEWMLTIADEEGRVFQHYEGSRYPPDEIVWSGQNDQGEWIRAGRAYSPVYVFTDPGGTPYTRAGDPIRFTGIVHQERDGLHLSLDSVALFGSQKSARSVLPEGESLIRAAADLVKRRYAGLPIRVEAYAGSKPLAEQQAQTLEEYLIKELMLLPQEISTDSLRTSYTDQRVEIVLVNR